MALLEVNHLHVSFHTADGTVRAVCGVSYHVAAGQTLGIDGESGSGKSVSTQAIMGLCRSGRVSGRALFEGLDLLLAGDHAYTQGLLQSPPAHGAGGERLRPIRGQPPSMLDPPARLPVRAALWLRLGQVPRGSPSRGGEPRFGACFGPLAAAQPGRP